MKYQIKSQNLNNSLVFYRALLDRMPDVLGFDFMKFTTEQFVLEINEGEDRPKQELILEVNKENELKKISKRMRRFRRIERFRQNCSLVKKAIGLIDPDGHRWTIGDPTADVEFEKCYVTL